MCRTRRLSVGSKDIVVIDTILAISTPSSVALAVERDHGVDTYIVGAVEVHEMIEMKMEHNILIVIAFPIAVTIVTTGKFPSD